MKVSHARILAAATFAVVACANPITPSTGLTGTVVRGPVTPVCTEGVPCDAPFAAHFTVLRGGQFVATFESGADGQFTVRLAPGTYTVVPAADAPIIDPSSQAKTVDVGAEGLTLVQLAFDTGIR